MAHLHEPAVPVWRRSLADAEQFLVSRLDRAQRELDAAMRASWQSCLIGEVQDTELRRRCQDALREVEALERELVGVRAARQASMGSAESAA